MSTPEKKLPIIDSSSEPSIAGLQSKLWMIQYKLDSSKLSGQLGEEWYLLLVDRLNKTMTRELSRLEWRLTDEVSQTLDWGLNKIEEWVTPMIEQDEVNDLSEVLENWNSFLDVIDQSYTSYFDTLEKNEFVWVYYRLKHDHWTGDVEDRSQWTTIASQIWELTWWTHEEHVTTQKKLYEETITSIREHLERVSNTDVPELKEAFFDMMLEKQKKLLLFWNINDHQSRIVPQSQIRFTYGYHKKEDMARFVIPSYLKNWKDVLDEEELLKDYWITNADELREVVNLPFNTKWMVENSSYDQQKSDAASLSKDLKWIMKLNKEQLKAIDEV